MKKLTWLETLLGAALIFIIFLMALLSGQRDNALHRVEELEAQLAEAHERPQFLVIDESASKKQNAKKENESRTHPTPVGLDRSQQPQSTMDYTTTYTEPQAPTESNDVSLLARLIMCEIGSDGHPDEQLYNVGSVVINRVNDPRFPNTLRDVIYQTGQYGPAITGIIENARPTQRCIDIATDLLANGSRLPADVVWQSGVTQGTEVYAAYTSPVTGTTTYYCR